MAGLCRPLCRPLFGAGALVRFLSRGGGSTANSPVSIFAAVRGICPCCVLLGGVHPRTAVFEWDVCMYIGNGRNVHLNKSEIYTSKRAKHECRGGRYTVVEAHSFEPF